MRKKLIFAGSGVTSGVGWNEADRSVDTITSPYLWTNLIHQNIQQLTKLRAVNVGKKHANNADIFQQVAEAISIYGTQIELLFCQWTTPFKHNWNVGFEPWNTSETTIRTVPVSHSVNLNNGKSWSREYINDVITRFLELHHVHWEIIKIVKYSNIILKLAKQFEIKIFFINASCPWDKNYFVELFDVEPNDYTKFTKKEILNIDNRNDEDIFKLYKLAHAQYQEAGGVDESDWINLYNSFLINQVDTTFPGASLGGVESNKIYYKIIENRLKELEFI
jgi:hypothetical protein